MQQVNWGYLIVLEWTNLHTLKADLQSVLRTLESLFLFFALRHVRYHKM